jgi:hypothetical protein
MSDGDLAQAFDMEKVSGSFHCFIISRWPKGVEFHEIGPDFMKLTWIS